jgi:hypothetical protein
MRGRAKNEIFEIALILDVAHHERYLESDQDTNNKNDACKDTVPK